MAHLLEEDRSGYRKLTQVDRDDRGNKLPGYYHTVALGPKRVQAAFPDHTFPREVKHYYAKEAQSRSSDDPLHHPKLEAAYQVKRWDESIPLDELDELVRQLDQTLYSVLAEAGVQVHSGPGGPYIKDAYFQAENRERQDDWIYEMDLTQIKHDQESIVLNYLKDGFSPVELEAFVTLVEDGPTSPKQIAENHDRHVESVRRALRRIDDLFYREYRKVSFRSPYVAELVYKKLKMAGEALKEVIDAAAKLSYADDRDLDEDRSAFIAWLATVGADVDDRNEGKLVLRMNEVESSSKLRRYLQRGYDLWVGAGRDPPRFREASVRFSEGIRTVAWRWL